MNYPLFEYYLFPIKYGPLDEEFYLAGLDSDCNLAITKILSVELSDISLSNLSLYQSFRELLFILPI